MSNTPPPALPEQPPPPNWYLVEGGWRYWDGTAWLPPQAFPPRTSNASVAAVFAWISWVFIFVFVWPLMVFAWVVPLAIRSSTTPGTDEHAMCDEALNTHLSGLAGFGVFAVVSALTLALAQVAGAELTALVFFLIALVLWLVWSMSLFVATVIGAVHAGNRRVWRCSWAMPLTKQHRVTKRPATR